MGKTIRNGKTITESSVVKVAPTGTIDITANGSYDVKRYASANVYIPMSAFFEEMSASNFEFDGNTCTNYIKPSGVLMIDGCSIPESYSIVNGNVVDGTEYKVTNIRGVDLNASSSTISRFTGYNKIELPKHIRHIDKRCFRGSNIKYLKIEETVKVDALRVFDYCELLIGIDSDKLDTSETTDMTALFQYCRNLQELDLSNFDTSKVTDMSGIFNQCNNLKSLDVSNFDTSNVENMRLLFSECRELENINLSNFNTSKVTNMYQMFNHCYSLISLDLSNFNTSNVTTMTSMFSYCSNLTSLDLSNFDTSNVTAMGQMFCGCKKLTEIPALNLSNVTNMSYMFDNCSSLTAIHCTGMKVRFDISSSTLFTRDALLEIINNCATVTTTQTLTMGEENLAKLTDEDKLILTNKGWTLA